MTHQEMIDQVSDELRNVSIATKITRWLNMSINEVGTLFVFGHLHKYNSGNTTLGIPDFSLPADFLWLKNIEIPSQQRKIYPEEESILEAAYPSYRTTQGVISRYYLNGTSVGLWQVPSGVFNITYAYQKRPAKLLADLSVSCDLPEEWHQLITQKATTKGYDYEGNDGGALKSKATERTILLQLGASVYRRPDDSVVLGSANYRNRPPRPKLPSHYPSFR